MAPYNSKEGGKYNSVMCLEDPGNTWCTTLMTTMMGNFPDMEREFRCGATKIQEDKCPLETVLFISFLYIAMLSLAPELLVTL